MKICALITSALAVIVANAAQDPIDWVEPSGEVVVTAEKVTADRVTGNVVVTGNVRAVFAPLRVMSESLERENDVFHFSDPTDITTCTNESCRLHWRLTGEMAARENHYVLAKNAWLHLWEVPVMWVPYWYYPLDTDYGWRIMPGWSSRAHAYVLTKYVYGIWANEDRSYEFRGSTRFDLRYENGAAVGETVRWKLGDWGKGHFRAYYAADENHRRYSSDRWQSRDYNYGNWESEVNRSRYAFELQHLADLTERDTLKVRASYLSDSCIHRDFLESNLYGVRNAFLADNRNEVALEHLENVWSAGVSVSGPVNDFYGGTSRLPEFYLDAMPMSLFGTRLVHEAEIRAGFLNREYGRRGNSKAITTYRYNPGPWADYQAFRYDQYHRLTAPFKVADVVSVVPRVGLRGTWWSDCGRYADPEYRAISADKDVFRGIIEGGVTFAARGTKWMDDGWSHVIEPYFDVLCQEANYSGLSKKARPYIFDNRDGSLDWSDQFAGRSRNLPYSWYGVTPGLRNAYRKVDERGTMRTVFDFDVYCAMQFNDTKWTEGGRAHRLARDPEDPNYGDDLAAVPGFRLRWFPTTDVALLARAEYDAENNHLAYGALEWRHKLSDSFSYFVNYTKRSHRWWDYSSTSSVGTRTDDFNWMRLSYFEAGFEQELCDAIAWSPYFAWDYADHEFEEIGGWVDYRTDCLGFRFIAAHRNGRTRNDGSKEHSDDRIGCFIYLRALGPSSGSAMFGN